LFCTPADIVRAEWSYDLARACQRFAGAIIDAEPDRLAHAVEVFANSLPAPVSQAERLVLRDRLRITLEDAAHQFHCQFHRHVPGRCDDRWRSGSGSLAWGDLDVSPHRLLREWGDRYLQDFERSHTWPGSMRAARMIRTTFAEPLQVDRIARAVGCCRSGLMRSFKAAYGMSMGEYQGRCRVRAAFDALREPESNVGAAAFRVGYQSTKNFYRALRALIGLTPSEVRGLPDADAADMVGTLLALPARASSPAVGKLRNHHPRGVTAENPSARHPSNSWPAGLAP
jgi:AraC-like DNA-binding protein